MTQKHLVSVAPLRLTRSGWPRFSRWLPALFVAACSLFLACSDRSDLGQVPPPPSGLKTASLLLDLSYEIETFTLITTSSQETTPLDEVMQAPFASKQRISLQLLDDGRVSWTIEELSPDLDTSVPHETLPSSLPAVHKTVLENGQMTLYDSEENVLAVETMELPDMIEWADKLLELGETHSEGVINDAIANMQSHLFVAQLDTLIQNAPGNGVIVSDLGNDIVSLRMPVSMSGMSSSSDIAVLLVNRDRNLLLASRLYDDADELKSSTMFRYDEGSVPLLRGFKQEVREVLPSGIEAALQIHATIDQLDFEIHL